MERQDKPSTRQKFSSERIRHWSNDSYCDGPERGRYKDHSQPHKKWRATEAEVNQQWNTDEENREGEADIGHQRNKEGIEANRLTNHRPIKTEHQFNVEEKVVAVHQPQSINSTKKKKMS